MAQCPNCNGSGRVLSHLNPHDVNKVGAGMGMHRCGRCNGQGVIHGASGNAGSPELGNGFMAIILGLFLHPVFSFVGFYLVCTGLFLWLVTVFGDNVLGDMLGLDENSPSTQMWVSAFLFGLPVVIAVAFRKFVPMVMKWILILGGSALIIWVIVNMTSFLTNR